MLMCMCMSVCVCVLRERENVYVYVCVWMFCGCLHENERKRGRELCWAFESMIGRKIFKRQKDKNVLTFLSRKSPSRLRKTKLCCGR